MCASLNFNSEMDLFNLSLLEIYSYTIDARNYICIKLFTAALLAMKQTFGNNQKWASAGVKKAMVQYM